MLYTKHSSQCQAWALFRNTGKKYKCRLVTEGVRQSEGGRGRGKNISERMNWENENCMNESMIVFYCMLLVH